MPRISRTDVEFQAEHQTWVARFVHSHNEEVGVVHRTQEGKFIQVKHLTQCKLGYKGSTVFLNGVSMCSLKDDYNWRLGIKRALFKALEKGGYCKFVRDEAGNEKLEVLKPSFGRIVSAFYRELPIKDYAPHNLKPQTPRGLAEAIASALEGELIGAPAATRNGTFHLGAD